MIHMEKTLYRVPIQERLRVWWQNWRVRKVGKAWRVIEQAIREDEGYRLTIHANIAMPIYDATRPICSCHWRDSNNTTNLEFIHAPGCQMHAHATVPRRFEHREMSIEQANYIADKLMAHLFKQPK
jgi:hypothetical protein